MDNHSEQVNYIKRHTPHSHREASDEDTQDTSHTTHLLEPNEYPGPICRASVLELTRE